ncbi:MAG: acyltransferase [Nitrososphaerota archaeon]|nr:acyltransferase [Nitrososphaerota archaeon]MDG6990748.1 acyltransferase [Nitrososphaerota archaeon]
MRGLASLYVLIYHIGVLFPSFGYLLTVSRLGFYGWSGVDFFFVLSGYLLAFLYSDTGVDIRYVLKRVFRTFPLYYLCVILFAIAGYVHLSPLWIIYAQNYFPQTFVALPFWTLALEEAFYFILFPALLWISKRADSTYLLILAAALSLSYRFLVPHTDYALQQLPSYLVDYVAGMWVARAKLPNASWLNGAGVAVWVGAGLILVENLNNPIAPVLDALAYSLIIATMQGSRVFTNRVSLWLGRISYSLYLSQLLILLPLARLVLPMILVVPLGALGCLLLAYALRTRIEEPFLLLGRLVIARVQQD